MTNVGDDENDGDDEDGDGERRGTDYPQMMTNNKHGKRGRRTANNNYNLTSAAIRGVAPGCQLFQK